MPEGVEKELTPGQRRFIEALLLGGTVQGAGEKAGVSKRTSLRWIKDPVVRAELGRLQQESLDSVLRLATTLAPAAIKVLGRNMQGEVPPNVQIRAAQVLLTQLVALSTFHDIAGRLQALEEVVQSRSGE